MPKRKKKAPSAPTVAELIEYLSTLDPKMPVLCWRGGGLLTVAPPYGIEVIRVEKVLPFDETAWILEACGPDKQRLRRKRGKVIKVLSIG